MTQGFTDEQKQYLQGFTAGSDVARVIASLPVLSGSGAGAAMTTISTGPSGPERIHHEAQDRFTAGGKKLAKEETAKREKNGLDLWDEMAAAAREDRFPKGTDVFMWKFQGLFYVAPAQDAFMCRLRIPGGALSAWQLRGIADLAEKHGGGYTDATTRANLQIREIPATQGPDLLLGLRDLGLIIQGSGADNIRNVTASPLSGLDPHEFIETLPLAKRWHHHILNHRELYGLPRKFNVAFEGGGTIASLQDTNDIGFAAVRVPEEYATPECSAGVYFRLQLGGITGHGDLARDTGVMVREDQCIDLADAIVRVFITHGDRTDRKKARLKYLLDAWGFEKFLQHVEEQLGTPLTRFDLAHCEQPDSADPAAHIGFHPQKQTGKVYAGIGLPVGRMTADQMRGVSNLAEQYGSGAIRLTVWQNLVIQDVDAERIDAMKADIEQLGLAWSASDVRTGLVACTGNAGCKFAGADTKAHAKILADYLESRIQTDHPINIHLTGCHHSCAQHTIGDIGLIATKVEVGDAEVEGYHLFVGGSHGAAAAIGHKVYESVPYDRVPETVERMLLAFREHRTDANETFAAFTSRYNTPALIELFEDMAVAL